MAKPSTLSLSLSLDRASILQRIKEAYLLWVNIVPHIAKSSRFTIGTRIEQVFLELLEQTYIAYFSSKEQKASKVNECILTLDVLKFLISVAWEGKIISNRHFEDLAQKLEEAGRMFGGWQKQLAKPEKKNRDR